LILCDFGREDGKSGKTVRKKRKVSLSIKISTFAPSPIHLAFSRLPALSVFPFIEVDD
jgi:hypothetical protein